MIINGSKDNSNDPKPQLQGLNDDGIVTAPEDLQNSLIKLSVQGGKGVICGLCDLGLGEHNEITLHNYISQGIAQLMCVNAIEKVAFSEPKIEQKIYPYIVDVLQRDILGLRDYIDNRPATSDQAKKKLKRSVTEFMIRYFCRNIPGYTIGFDHRVTV